MAMVLATRCTASVLSQSPMGQLRLYPRTSSLEDILIYDTAFLEEYLLAQGIFATRKEAQAAIVECKKFLWQAVQRPGLNVVSDQVDAVWHAWLLHTAQYMTFCDACFGTFIHHAPAPIPMAATTPGMGRCSIEQHGHDGNGRCHATCVS